MNVTKMAAVSSDPSIVTLEMDKESQERFNALRNTHFPVDRNWLQAHLTLFHHLPSAEPDIIDALNELSSITPPFNLTATSLISLGSGVAFRIEDDRLQGVHRLLQRRWWDWLTPQDRQKREFHVTIQNKVSAATAKHLLQQLRTTFQPFSVKGTGFSLWTYKNGPWEWNRSFVLPDPTNEPC